MLEILEKCSNTIGMIGVVIILIAYYLLNTGKMSADSMKYQWINLLGAVFILISLFFHWNTASVTIEVAWIVISLIGMYRSKTKTVKKSTPQLYVINDTKISDSR